MRVEIKPSAIRRMNRSIRLVYGKASKETRERMVDRVFDAIDRLKEYPRSGQFEPWLEHLQMGHRRLVVGKFKVIYRILSEVIIVTDIFDARRDPKKMKG